MANDTIRSEFAQLVSEDRSPVLQDKGDRIIAVRLLYSKLLTELERICPSSRALSVAKTELETSAMWAIKAIAHAKPEELPTIGAPTV